ncbi:hypothetical protein ABT369_36830 [Dactylosporangium sp. NPDC000244]|uniref:hypothetical protein n=1 Tax=Dactylosporangium sp. NPDC000244 TaxID=3154365 RepID=UPI00332B30B5
MHWLRAGIAYGERTERVTTANSMLAREQHPRVEGGQAGADARRGPGASRPPARRCRRESCRWHGC